MQKLVGSIFLVSSTFTWNQTIQKHSVETPPLLQFMNKLEQETSET